MIHFPSSTVMVPVDFSDASWSAVSSARALVSEPGALHLVHVLPPNLVGPDAPFLDVVDQGDLLAEARRQLAGRLDTMGLGDAHVHVSFAPGNPAATICEMARSLEAQLVVLPSHGRTGLARLALGSVAERVVRLAPCAVLVLRH